MNKHSSPPVNDFIGDQLINAEADSVPEPRPPVFASRAAQIVTGLSLVLIAFNLRPVFSSASAILPEIIEQTGLSSLGAGVLTTLPVVCLGLFAPLAPKLAQRIGAERTLLAVLVLLAFGTALRGFGSLALLFAGTALAGACIAVGNVLLPGLVKRDFASRTGMMTGLYTMALCAGAASAAGLTVPLKHALGDSWSLALGAWALPALLVALIWFPHAFFRKVRTKHAGFRVEGLWRDRLAWQVTLFMGLQSSLAYCVFGWLSPILRERGLDGVTAGVVVSVSVMAQVFACLLVPSIAVRCRNQQFLNVGLVALAVIGLLGFLFAPISTVWLWAIIQGLGQGGLIAIAMTIIVLRSPNAHVASHLSGMAQCIGYILAATGPLLVGLVHSLTGSFAATAALFLALGAGAAIFGWGAGRSVHVGAKTTELP
ncbi:CynX/NimT family MFS transporter [Phyllobacterium endophyticum]|uniref:Cyanate transporter n=1 Tax=Phyllobacterium endophyticum TaxID=1149773 RepID=A0A2P7AUY7_9HYPH|nr:CynX/NimT family MFS transporter [Phyllobacterium endophyticum]MBB3234565.1 CP family cyanate transporter-like MFS transporter [Phyllobacterium endophyticum]PSH58042.1 cyanate transporter [Phyllobacterium endophyticum]TYR38714.1 CynX/NimT family MFS transporter [Phyllobacterium endophyticum]